MNKKTFKKRAFISAIAMLVVSAIVLTSATFAWFAMSSEVKVDQMKLSITAPQGVQISGNPFAFTSALLFDNLQNDYDKSTNRFGAYPGNMNNFPTALEPVSTAFCANSGSQNTFNNKFPAFYKGEMTDDGSQIVIACLSKNTKNTYYGEKEASTAPTPFAAFDIFIKVSETKEIYFGKSSIDCESNEDVPCAMRMGFVNCGVLGEIKEKEFQADQVLNVKPAVAGYYENYKVLAFDAEHHTADAINNYRTATNPVTEGVTRTTDAVYLTGTFNVVNGNKAYTNYASPSYEVEKYTDGTLTVRQNGGEEESSDVQSYIKVQPGINRVRIYIWMEGNDEDCASDIAGQDLDIKVVFYIIPGA